MVFRTKPTKLVKKNKISRILKLVQHLRDTIVTCLHYDVFRFLYLIFGALMAEQKQHVGGQAVIEGVMMRSPERVAIAVRRSDGKIVLKNDPYVSYTKRHKFWNLPIVRGAVILIESMVLGVKALTFSGDIAVEIEDQPSKKKTNNSLWLGMTVVFSLALGLLIFFYLPLKLTEFLGLENGFTFNLVDGILRMLIFLLYLYLITMMKDIRRVFQYHGAEHKSIFTYEANQRLTIENTQKFKPYHPRW